MCGRFYVDDEMEEEIIKICNTIDKKKMAHGDVAPTDKALLLCKEQEKEDITGITGAFGYKVHDRVIFNARSETVWEKPLFKNDFMNHRCIIPARSFYEWNHKKEKFVISAKSKSDVLYFGGIYRKTMTGNEFVILTTEAVGKMKEIHDRMPLSISRKEINGWIYDNKEAMQYLVSEGNTDIEIRKLYKKEGHQLSLFEYL